MPAGAFIVKVIRALCLASMLLTLMLLLLAFVIAYAAGTIFLVGNSFLTCDPLVTRPGRLMMLGLLKTGLL